MSDFMVSRETGGVAYAPAFTSIASSLAALPVNNDRRDDVLAFLAERPTHSVYMAGLILDNGLMSPLNRGTFYAYQDAAGAIEGVALLGHATLVEARTEAALAAFADTLKYCPSIYLIRGEQSQVARLWRHYASNERTPRLVCRELLFEQRTPIDGDETMTGLRPAAANDLPRLLPVLDQMHFEESRIHPMEVDPIGFKQRWLRRVEDRRVWVLTDGDRLVFSAAIVANTPDCIYLEGIYVSPQERRRGYGLRCLLQLCRSLLIRTKSICLTVNEQNHRAVSFYRKAGFKLHSYLNTVYLEQKIT